MFGIKIVNTWEPGYDVFVLSNRPKSNSCQLPYQPHSSSAVCAWAVQGLKRISQSSSLLSKKIFWLGVVHFCEWRHKWSSFWAILAHVTWLRAQPLGQSILLKISLETRLKSFKTLIDFIAFLVQKLWSKINKLINYLKK